MATVFDLFKEIDYQYVVVNRGTVFGNELDEVSNTYKGVFKSRSGYTRTGNNIEKIDGELATLHAHPEDFTDFDSIVGNCVVVNNIYYEVKGLTVGTNFDSGVVEHLTLSLQRADYVQGDENDN